MHTRRTIKIRTIHLHIHHRGIGYCCLEGFLRSEVVCNGDNISFLIASHFHFFTILWAGHSWFS